MISRSLRLALILLAVCRLVRGTDASAPPHPTRNRETRNRSSILLTGQPGLPAASAVARVSLEARLGLVDAGRHRDRARGCRALQGNRLQHHLRALYRFKYAGRPFDAIVVRGKMSRSDSCSGRAMTSGGTPIIVCAVDERTLGGFPAPPEMTVVTVTYDMEGTLRAALALLPDTRHVALIGGASVEDRAWGNGEARTSGGSGIRRPAPASST